MRLIDYCTLLGFPVGLLIEHRGCDALRMLKVTDECGKACKRVIVAANVLLDNCPDATAEDIERVVKLALDQISVLYYG